MVIFVIITNLIITVLNFYLAWKIWQVQSWLVKLKESLILLDQRLYHTLVVAPVLLERAKNQTQVLESKYQKLRQIVDIIGKLFLLWGLLKNRSLT
ncbi:hypothetical protein [Gloeocapsa sp. PCC 73106]|uniref:hypothetical protein n=1 Tax=Gloeocapsa sp. PCC 73106 TaxID=102232 RepID=UPI0002AC4CE7|nr:hypothetical protein [Gloeocapsa sp. PCC 73106]ELR99414.1 hypothetical protein GLO73106DRAFT_00032650 [Gloeocapsa sp. PCC 73106]